MKMEKPSVSDLPELYCVVCGRRLIDAGWQRCHKPETGKHYGWRVTLICPVRWISKKHDKYLLELGKHQGSWMVLEQRPVEAFFA